MQLDYPSTNRLEAAVFEYVWRHSDDPGKRKFARWKNIVKPFNVDYNAVHYIEAGKPAVSINAWLVPPREDG
jgi:hypothetical protein